MKKIIITILSISLLFIIQERLVLAETIDIQPDIDAPIFSDEIGNINEAPLINLEDDPTEYTVENSNSRAVLIRSWKIDSKKSAGTTTGGWRAGPSGRGKATLSATNSNTNNRSVTATISGDAPIGASKIGASLGINIGTSKSYGVSYSISIPKGKRQQIIFRPVYKLTSVKQRLYINGAKTNTIKTATVKSFSNWDYSFKTI